MNSAFLGLVAAISWGIHDFIGRYTSRATSQLVTTFGLVLSGLVILTIYGIAAKITLPRGSYEVALTALAGASYAMATLCLFAAYRIGSLSIVSPIAGSYPAVAVAFNFATGSRPSLIEWTAIFVVIGGSIAVAMAGKSHEDQGIIEPGKLPLMLGLASATALFFAVSLIAGQIAVPLTGEIAVTWLARLFALAAIVPFFAVRAMRGPAPIKWWPVLILMGLLDTIAMMSVFSAGNQPNAEFAIVLGGSFGAVVTLLAWSILKEPVAVRQWVGIAMICCGAGVLSAGLE